MMPRLFKKRSSKTGLPPGTLVHIGEKRLEEVTVTHITYSEESVKESEVKHIDELFPLTRESGVHWIRVTGIHNVAVIDKLGTQFGLHPLLQEDILNSDQRPKMEEFDNALFFVLKALHYNQKTNEVNTEQISFVLFSQALISFQEYASGLFEPIRERIEKRNSHIVKMGADYLIYCLIDAVVDHYFHIIEILGEKIEAIEDQIAESSGKETLKHIQKLKNTMLILRKVTWPLRDALKNLEISESPLISKQTDIYFRDVYDHAVHIIDTIEIFRETLISLANMYLSGVSNRMNEIMKVLTVISTIFIPLMFVAGIYGMNFSHMPELEWGWGYYYALTVMGCITVIMLLFFRSKKWF
jgi:magnesium transporter